MNRRLQLALHAVGLPVEHPDRAPIPRSGKWRAFEARLIRERKRCRACGNTKVKELTGHHVVPFHVAPEHELDDTNIEILCSNGPGIHCHLFWGHAGNFRLINPRVREDADAAGLMLAVARTCSEAVLAARARAEITLAETRAFTTAAKVSGATGTAGATGTD